MLEMLRTLFNLVYLKFTVVSLVSKLYLLNFKLNLFIVGFVLMKRNYLNLVYELKVYYHFYYRLLMFLLFQYIFLVE